MAAPKGVAQNPKGKPKGALNKTTIEFKEALKNLLDMAAPDMVDWLAEIDDPFKRFEVMSKFAEYIHPKLNRTEHKNPDGETFKVEQVLNKSDQEILNQWREKK